MSSPKRTEQSSIIDIRKLGALIDDAPPASSRVVRPSESAVSLPTFGAEQLTRPLAPAPKPDAPPPPVLAAPPRSPETTMLLVAIGTLAIVVAGLAYYVAIRPAPQTIVRETVPTVAAAPAVAAAEAPKREDPVAVGAVLERDEPKDESTEEPEEESTDEATPETTKAQRRSQPRKRDRIPTKSEPVEAKPPKPTPTKTKPPKNDHLPAECVIDPEGCGLGSKPGIDKPTKKDKAEDLPEKLGQPAVRKGLSKVKATAKQCGSRHGVTGQTVHVKLTLRGSTGQVTQATPMKPHAGTAVGSCVAAALKKAQFDRFGASVQGVQYGVRL